MFNQQQQFQQLQQQQLQQQQLLQLQQLLQQSPPQAPLPMTVSRGLPQQQPQQQLLTLQGTSPTSLLNGSVLQRALLLQQLQGNLRGYNLATPNLTPPSLTPPQLATPNLQQFFPQATRQSLLGPPPVGVPINPSQLNLSGRTPQKQTRTSSSTTPNRKASSSQPIYPSFCERGQFHDVSESTHWTPFLNASVHYIRKNYPLPWDEDTEKLVAFLFGITSHMVADVNWHSLGIEQGFLRTMAAIDFHNSYPEAHPAGDFGGDVLSQFEFKFNYLSRHWYVPAEALLGIYKELYGRVVIKEG